jgi:hypothetical protein
LSEDTARTGVSLTKIVLKGGELILKIQAVHIIHDDDQRLLPSTHNVFGAFITARLLREPWWPDVSWECNEARVPHSSPGQAGREPRWGRRFRQALPPANAIQRSGALTASEPRPSGAVKKFRPLMNADKPPMAWRPPVDHENARSAAHLRMSIGFGRIHHFKDIHVFSEQRGLKMLVFIGVDPR